MYLPAGRVVRSRPVMVLTSHPIPPIGSCYPALSDRSSLRRGAVPGASPGPQPSEETPCLPHPEGSRCSSRSRCPCSRRSPPPRARSLVAHLVPGRSSHQGPGALRPPRWCAGTRGLARAGTMRGCDRARMTGPSARSWSAWMSRPRGPAPRSPACWPLAPASWTTRPRRSTWSCVPSRSVAGTMRPQPSMGSIGAVSSARACRRQRRWHDSSPGSRRSRPAPVRCSWASTPASTGCSWPTRCGGPWVAIPFGIAPLDLKSLYMGRDGVGRGLGPAALTWCRRYPVERPHTHNALDDARSQAESARRLLTDPR